MNRKTKLQNLFFSLFVILSSSSVCHAQLTIATVFSDHMVLQQGMKVPVWGSAKAGDRITVSFNKAAVVATTGADGQWIAYLKPMEASMTGRELKVTAAGYSPLVITDVLVGEVWLCSGQSNMRMEMAFRDKNIPGVVNSQEEIKKASYPALRFYNRFREKGAPLWEKCDTTSVKLFSAVAYYFGVEILENQKVPVGLIHQSAGGTSIQKWIPQNALRELAWTSGYIGRSKEPQWSQPSFCYNNLIAPLVKFAIRGAIWYQGESNANKTDQAYSYRYLLPQLISAWRKEWGQGDFPFAFVQLPVFEQSVGNRYVREAQLLTLKSIPQTGMITIYDQDEYRNMLHPPNKKHVGERLAMWAIADVYGKPASARMGPVYQRFEKTAGGIKIWFTESGKGLKNNDGRELRNFMIASEDGNFLPAKAEIGGKDFVVVSSPSVPAPIYVRYSWGEKIIPGNLVNDRDLPASPFRTDTLGNHELEKTLMAGIK